MKINGDTGAGVAVGILQTVPYFGEQPLPSS